MDNPLSPFPTTPSSVLSDYCGLKSVFRSWFWRFYDHLFRLILYNIGWVLTWFCVAWLAVRLGWVEISKPLNLSRLFRLYALYLAESAVSVGWAYAVFKVVVEGEGKTADFWHGFRRYGGKAVGVAAVSGFLIGWAGYNLFFYASFGKSPLDLRLLLTAFVLWILVSWLSTCLYQWPLLFFQNPPFLKIFYKSGLLALGNSLGSLGILLFFACCFGLFLIAYIPSWLFAGAVFFFSFQCVALEKNLLKYRITYGDKPLEPFLERLDREKKRGWKDFFRPWENR